MFWTKDHATSEGEHVIEIPGHLTVYGDIWHFSGCRARYHIVAVIDVL